MNVAQRVAVNTTTQIAGQVLGVFVSLAALRVTTGYLGIDEFGELAIILAVGGLVVTISDVGVTTTLARELAKAPENVDRLAGSLLRFRLVGSLLLVLGTLVIIPVLPYSTQAKVGLVIYLVGILAQSIATFPKAFFQTHLELHLQAAVDFATRVFTLVAVSLVAVLDLGFYALVAFLAVAGIGGLIVAFWFLRRFWRVSLRWDGELGGQLVRDSLAVGVVSIIGLLHFRGDAILLSLLAPAQDVGIYAVAYRFIDQAFILPGFFVAAMFPILTRLVHEGPGRADEAINRTFQVLLLGSVAILLGVVTLAEPIIRVIAGEDFDQAAEPARILAFCLPFIFCAPVFYNLCIAVNKQRALIWMGVASLGLNVALNLVLIPRYTYNGAAITTVVSEGVSFLGSVVIARRSVRFRFETFFLLRAGAATAAASLAAFFLWSHSLILAFAAAELVLVAMAYATRAIASSDLRAVLGSRRSTEEAG